MDTNSSGNGQHNALHQSGDSLLDDIRDLLAQYARIRYALYKARKKTLEELNMTEAELRELEAKIAKGLRRPSSDDDIYLDMEEGGVQLVSTPFFSHRNTDPVGFRWKLHYYAPKEK